MIQGLNPLGMPPAHTEVLQVEFGLLRLLSSFLPVCVLGGSRWWLRCLDPCHPCGDPDGILGSQLGHGCYRRLESEPLNGRALSSSLSVKYSERKSSKFFLILKHLKKWKSLYSPSLSALVVLF